MVGGPRWTGEVCSVLRDRPEDGWTLNNSQFKGDNFHREVKVCLCNWLCFCSDVGVT